MWRPSYNIFRKVIMPSLIKQNSMAFKNITNSKKTSTVKLTLISASVGVLIGAGYGGYTHYKVNANKGMNQFEAEEFAVLKELPYYKPQYKVIHDSDSSNLKLVLFQYRTCPFCCKVRAYLDSRGIAYEIVEVDAVLRQAIKWSGYKKVPILLAKVEGGYQQLLDSSAIISILETYFRDKSTQLPDVVKFYPATRHTDPSGKVLTDVANKYFVMHNAPVPDVNQRNVEQEERQWRQWADQLLVHMLSPNVYRTMGESLETFKWFEEVGGWKNAFPAWECALMVYGGATAMWIIAKRLKARHNIGEVRQALYDATNEWMNAVKKKGTPFLGGDQPNLADITVYGVFSSIEGCQAFKDLRAHTEIGKWYDNIKSSIERQKGTVVAVAHA